MAKYSYVGYKRPRNTKNTLKHLLHYMGLHKWMFLLVGLLVCVSTGASVMGTYLLKPVINRFIMLGNMKGLVSAVAAMGVMYPGLQSAYDQISPDCGAGDPKRSLCPRTDPAVTVF